MIAVGVSPAMGYTRSSFRPWSRWFAANIFPARPKKGSFAGTAPVSSPTEERSAPPRSTQPACHALTSSCVEMRTCSRWRKPAAVGSVGLRLARDQPVEREEDVLERAAAAVHTGDTGGEQEAVFDESVEERRLARRAHRHLPAGVSRPCGRAAALRSWR